MPKFKPLGDRVIVEDIIPESDVKRRGEAAGLKVIVYEENEPKPTTGRVLAIGSGPLIQELHVGDEVWFSKHAGTHNYLEGKEYRTLEYQEITNVLCPHEATDQQALPESEVPAVTSPSDPKSPA